VASSLIVSDEKEYSGETLRWVQLEAVVATEQVKTDVQPQKRFTGWVGVIVTAILLGWTIYSVAKYLL